MQETRLSKKVDEVQLFADYQDRKYLQYIKNSLWSNHIRINSSPPVDRKILITDKENVLEYWVELPSKVEVEKNNYMNVQWQSSMF